MSSSASPPPDQGDVTGKYRVRIVPRTFSMTADDWHATVERRSDGKQYVEIAAWRWLLRWKVRRAAIERNFRAIDRHARKMATVDEYIA